MSVQASSSTFTAPYPGLRPFERNEAPLFYGRGTHIAAMLKILRNHHFLAVVGSSGCGKSSLVRAGLLPALDDGFLGGPDCTWRFAVMRPGNAPQRHLAAALVKAAAADDVSDEETVVLRLATLRSGPGGLLQAIDDSLLPDNTRVLILADQFEEIFRFRTDSLDAARDAEMPPEQLRNDAVAFVNQLLWTAQANDPRVYVALTMRSDFLGDCDAFLNLPQAINRSQFLPPSLTRDELIDVITRPPKSGNFSGSIDDDVTARLLNSMGGSQDLLPLLQHALLRMWNLASNGSSVGEDSPKRITQQHYERAGGLDRALDRHANEVLHSLVSAQDTGDRAPWIAECLFAALCRTSGEGRTVRRLATVGEVAAVADVPLEEVIAVADHFRQPGVNFLLATPAGSLAADSTLDISHESLIRQWSKLRQWLATEQESADVYLRLVQSAKMKAQRKGGWLEKVELQHVLRWKAQRRPTAAWADRYAPGSFVTSMEFLDGSRLDAKRRKQEIEQQRLREEQHKEEELKRSRHLNVAVVAIAAVLATILGWALWAQWRANQEATKAEAVAIMAGLRGEGDSPTQDEYESLRLLADSRVAVRTAFMEHLLTSPAKAARLRSRNPYILHAIVGLDTEDKQWLQRLLISHGKDPEAKPVAINITCAELGALLRMDTADFTDMVVGNYLAASKKPTDYLEFSALDRTFGSWSEKLPAEHATAVAQQIVAAMENTIDDKQWFTLGKAFDAVSEKLPADDATILAQQIVAAVENATDYDQLSALGRALGSVGEKLPAEHATDFGHQIVAAMENTTDHYRLSALGRALGDFAEKLLADLAARGAQHVVVAMEQTTDYRELYDLGRALGSLAEHFPAEQATAGGQQIVSAMEQTTDFVQLSALGMALGSLGEQLPAEQAATGGQKIVVAMEQTTDYGELHELASALGSLAKHLPAEQATAAAQQIVSAMEQTTDYRELYDLGRALSSLSEKLPAEQAVAGVQQILAVMEQTTDYGELRELASALGSLSEKLPAEQAVAGVQRILSVMEQTTNPAELHALGMLLFRWCESLSAVQAGASAPQIILALERMTDSHSLSTLGSVLGRLGENLPDEQAAALAQQIIAAMEQATDLDRISALSRALGSLGENLPAEQAAAIAQQIMIAMEEATDLRQLSDLGTVLGSLGKNLPAEQAAAIAQQIMLAMEEATDLDRISTLSRALGSLGENLPAEQAAAIAQQIMIAMEATDLHQLSDLGMALGSLGKNLPAKHAAAGAQQIVAAMEKHTSYRLLVLGSTLGSLAQSMNLEATFAVLKSLVCVGKTREEVLAGLEKKTGQNFDGNIWKAVQWAESPPQSIDIKSIPRWPLQLSE